MSDQIGLLNVLVVEDDPKTQVWIRDLTLSLGVPRVEIAGTGSAAEAELRGGRYNCAIVDMDLPDGRYRGAQILDREEFDLVFKIMLTRFPEDQTRALLHGARRFIVKSEVGEDASRLKLALCDAALFVQHRLAVHYQSQSMAQLFKEVAVIARRDDPVLIVGESGVGKELIAHAIHKISPRGGGPFEAINCACLDPTTAESDLFGVADGAYTGTHARPGVFERGNGGTIFFDEIAEMGIAEQKRLLRILENPTELMRAGGYKKVLPHGRPVSFRCLFATDTDLREAVDQRKFHSPLFQRISTYIVDVPPLNERREDIPILVRVFFRNHFQDVERLSAEALEVLRNADWAGSNVRGLWNALSKALVIAESREDSASATITEEDAEQAIRISRSTRSGDSRSIGALVSEARASLSEVEGAYIAAVLKETGGRIAEAARILDVGRNTLYEKVRRYHLEHLLPSRSSS